MNAVPLADEQNTWRKSVRLQGWYLQSIWLQLHKCLWWDRARKIISPSLLSNDLNRLAIICYNTHLNKKKERDTLIVIIFINILLTKPGFTDLFCQLDDMCLKDTQRATCALISSLWILTMLQHFCESSLKTCQCFECSKSHELYYTRFSWQYQKIISAFFFSFEFSL